MSTHHDIICVDIKSFYASCECIFRGLNPLSAKLVVVGDINRNGSVVLAASPQMKKQYHINTGSRLFEVKNINDPQILICQARMKKYLSMSKKIVDIFLQYVPPNALHVYSVDESWLTLDGTLTYHNTNVTGIAQKIQKQILHDTGLIAAVGIGDNKFLAKAALDIYAKKEGISEIRQNDVPLKLHPVAIREMWGIGEKMEYHLHNMGIYTIGDIAHAPIEFLRGSFGINGVKLHEYANGIDNAPIFYNEENPPDTTFGFENGVPRSLPKSIGRGVTLLKDYVKINEIQLVIRELVDEVCHILRKRKLVGKTMHLSIGYSHRENTPGFSRQKTILLPTNDTSIVFSTCFSIFNKFYIPNVAVRKINVSVSKIIVESPDSRKEKRQVIAETADKINDKFGNGTIARASSLTKHSVAQNRNKKIKGHFK